MQNNRTESLLVNIEKELDSIRSSVHSTRLDLLDSIESFHKIREEIIESMQSS